MPDTDQRARPVEVRALKPYRIWLSYDDGTEGEVDLSHLASRRLFAACRRRRHQRSEQHSGGRTCRHQT